MSSVHHHFVMDGDNKIIVFTILIELAISVLVTHRGTIILDEITIDFINKVFQSISVEAA